ncbi:MAG: hypothetical protein IT326_07435 [Anaerolineae bacterium]|nr:hypothetical protein [Anaerolineae bacterium]
MKSDGLKGLALACVATLSLAACSSAPALSEGSAESPDTAIADISAQSAPAGTPTAQTPAAASGLPAEEPAAYGMFAGWQDDTSFTIQSFGRGGRGDDMAMTPAPAETGAIAVLVTADTILYEDVSVMPERNSPDGTPGMPPFAGTSGAGPGGPAGTPGTDAGNWPDGAGGPGGMGGQSGFTRLPQAVTAVTSLEAMMDGAQVTVWGTLENNQVTASVIVYRNGGGMRQPR